MRFSHSLVKIKKESHCLRDLLYLHELGVLPVEIPLVLANIKELRELFAEDRIIIAGDETVIFRVSQAGVGSAAYHLGGGQGIYFSISLRSQSWEFPFRGPSCLHVNPGCSQYLTRSRP